jgi:hypothetical protein
MQDSGQQRKGNTPMQIHMPRTLMVLLLSAVLAGVTVPAGAEIFPGMPDVIVCDIDIPQQGRRGSVVFYLDAQEEGRMTRYTSLGAAPMQVRIGADGSISQDSLGDCAGRTVAQLRQADRAFDVE